MFDKLQQLKELKKTWGGIAANIAYSLAMLGEHPVLYGSAGRDARGYMGKLARRGVDVSLVHFSKLPTASFTVLTDQDDNQIGGFHVGAMGDAVSLSLKPFAKKNVFVVVSAHDPTMMRRQTEEAKKFGLRLVYDVSSQAPNISGEDIRLGIEAAEALVVNDYEMGVIEKKTGWSEPKIAKKLKVCVVTLGGKGCRAWVKGKQQTDAKAVELSKIVDPTGAGDAFRAGFLYGYIRDWPVKQCAQLGCVTASFAVEKRGAQAHRFTKQTLAKRYLSTYGETLEWAN